MFLVIAINFDGKVKKLSSKDKTPLISMRGKPYLVMFLSSFFLLIFLGSLGQFLSKGGLYLFFSTLFLLCIFIVLIFCYFKNGNIDFYNDELEIIPFFGKKKIYKYNGLSVCFGLGPRSFFIGGGVLINIINNKNFHWLDSFYCSKVSGLFHKNQEMDFFIAAEMLTEKIQNIRYYDKFQWEGWRKDRKKEQLQKEIKDERKQ